MAKRTYLARKSFIFLIRGIRKIRGPFPLLHLRHHDGILGGRRNILIIRLGQRL